MFQTSGPNAASKQGCRLLVWNTLQATLLLNLLPFVSRAVVNLLRDVPKKLKLELKTRPCKNGGTYYQNQTFADLGQSCWSLSPWGCSEWEAPGCCKLSKLPGCSAGPDQATWCTKKEFATLRKMKKYFYSLEKVVQLGSFPAVPDHVPSPLQFGAPK